jgi:hypothetical protein
MKRLLVLLLAFATACIYTHGRGWHRGTGMEWVMLDGADYCFSTKQGTPVYSADHEAGGIFSRPDCLFGSSVDDAVEAGRLETPMTYQELQSIKIVVRRAPFGCGTAPSVLACTDGYTIVVRRGSIALIPQKMKQIYEARLLGER